MVETIEAFEGFARFGRCPIYWFMACLRLAYLLFRSSLGPLWVLGFRGAKEEVSRRQRGGKEEAKRRNRRFMPFLRFLRFFAFEGFGGRSEGFGGRRHQQHPASLKWAHSG